MHNKTESRRVISIVKRSPNAELLRHHPNQGVPESVFNQIAQKFPQCRVSPTRIEMERKIEDPELASLLSFAKESGAIVQKDQSDSPAQVYVTDFRVYSEDELARAPFMECFLTAPWIESILPSDHAMGLIYSFSSHTKRSEDIAFGHVGNLFHIIAVRGKAKKRLEEANLKHLQLLPLPTDLPNGEWPSGIAPFYIIWSDYRLPQIDLPLYDRRNLVYPRGEHPVHTPGGYYLLDGFDLYPRLRFKDIEDSDIDIGVTAERLGGDEQYYHKIIYSQKAVGVLRSLAGC